MLKIIDEIIKNDIIDNTVNKIVDNVIKKKLHSKIDYKIDEKIKPLFSCNGKCSYCIEHKCLDI